MSIILFTGAVVLLLVALIGIVGLIRHHLVCRAIDQRAKTPRVWR